MLTKQEIRNNALQIIRKQYKSALCKLFVYSRDENEGWTYAIIVAFSNEYLGRKDCIVLLADGTLDYINLKSCLRSKDLVLLSLLYK